jgi:hypothetical protein
MVGACTIHVYSHFDKVKILKNCKIDEVTWGYLTTSTMGLLVAKNKGQSLSSFKTMLINQKSVQHRNAWLDSMTTNSLIFGKPWLYTYILKSCPENHTVFGVVTFSRRTNCLLRKWSATFVPLVACTT